MEENKKHQPEEKKSETQKQDKTPIQPEKPVGEITSSGDNVRRPEHGADIPPEDQTKGNP